MLGIAFLDFRPLSVPTIDWGKKVRSFLQVTQAKVRLGDSRRYRLDPVRPEDREGLCRAYASIADTALEISMPPGPSGYVHLSEDGQRLIYVEARQTAFLSEEEKPEKEFEQLGSARYVNMSVEEFGRIVTTKASRGESSRHLVDPAFKKKLGGQISSEDLNWIAPRILGTLRARRALQLLVLSK
ncbi:MAG: hypothetical protein EOM37_01280 [Proteobacteria bacterium]|jgi:hypothetical protein|nr:hypothetical protein [Pseudomonadota bacterium]